MGKSIATIQNERASSLPSESVGSDGDFTIIRDEAGLAQLEGEWKALFDSSPAASPPLRFEWVQEWWRVFGPIYGDGPQGLRILTIRRDGRLIGILPLYAAAASIFSARLRRLRFISSGAAEFEETCAEYQNLLHAPGEEWHCIQSLTSALLDSRKLNWDELELSDVPENSPLLSLAATLHAAGRSVNVESNIVSHLTNLQQGVEAYVAGLSATTRKKARKMLQPIDEATGLKFEIARTEDEAGVFFDQLVDLHHERWAQEGKTGSFAPRHAQFHKAMVARLAAKGAVVLARLSFHDQPIALIYGHRVGKKFDAYQMGVSREKTATQSPGTHTFLAMIAALNRDGVEIYDHLPGSNRFKQDYAKDQRVLFRLQAVRPTYRLVASKAISFGYRIVRKSLAILLMT